MALDLSSLLACQREREEKRKDYYSEELREKEPVAGESSSWILLCDRYSTIEVVDGCGSHHRITSCFRDGELTHTHRASLSGSTAESRFPF